MPVSRGTASGHVGVEQAANRAGLRAYGDGSTARLSGSATGQDVRQAEQRDPEVLGDVARVLDGPLGVVAKARVAIGLEDVQVVVGRMEDLAGRRDVVEDQREHRQGRAEPGGPASSPPVSRPSRRARRTGRRTRRSAAPCRRARRAGRPRTADDRPTAARGARSGRPVGGLRDRRDATCSVRRVAPPVVGIVGRPVRRRRRCRRQAASARPRRCGPGTTSSSAGRCTRRRCRRRGTRVPIARTAGRTGSRPSIHQQIATSTAARIVKIAWSSVASPHNGHERQQDDGRQRWERQEAARHAVGRGDRQHVLEECVARQRRRSPRPGSGSRPGPRGRPRPARRSGRSSGRPGSPSRWRGPRSQGTGRPRWPASGAIRRSGHGVVRGVRPGTLCYAPIHLSTLVQEPFPGDWPRIRWDRARLRKRRRGRPGRGTPSAQSSRSLPSGSPSASSSHTSCRGPASART